MCTMFGLYIIKLKATVTLTLNDLKINRDHLHTEMNVCTKFGDPSSILCQVIILTRPGIPTDRPTDGRTDRPTNMSKAIYPHFVEGGHNDKKQNTQKFCVLFLII